MAMPLGLHGKPASRWLYTGSWQQDNCSITAIWNTTCAQAVLRQVLHPLSCHSLVPGHQVVRAAVSLFLTCLLESQA